MYETILGGGRFRRATDLYFERHDGQAVTCNDFCTSMEDGNWEGLGAIDGLAKSEDPMVRWVDAPFLAAGDRPLQQFRRWYAVAGTPEVGAKVAYDEEAKTVTVTLTQTVPDTPTQKGPKPALHIPIRTAMLGPDGVPMPLKLRADPAEWSQRWGKAIKAGVEVPGDDAAVATEAGGAKEVVLHLTESEQTFVLEGVPSKPVPSVLRGFSAPVRLTLEGDSLENRLFRLAHDTDVVCKTDAAAAVAADVILARVPTPEGANAGSEPIKLAADVEDAFFQAMGGVITAADLDGKSAAGAASIDPALTAHILSMPSLAELE